MRREPLEKQHGDDDGERVDGDVDRDGGLTYHGGLVESEDEGTLWQERPAKRSRRLADGGAAASGAADVPVVAGARIYAFAAWAWRTAAAEQLVAGHASVSVQAHQDGQRVALGLVLEGATLAQVRPGLKRSSRANNAQGSKGQGQDEGAHTDITCINMRVVLDAQSCMTGACAACPLFPCPAPPPPAHPPTHPPPSALPILRIIYHVCHFMQHLYVQASLIAPTVEAASSLVALLQCGRLALALSGGEEEVCAGTVPAVQYTAWSMDVADIVFKAASVAGDDSGSGNNARGSILGSGSQTWPAAVYKHATGPRPRGTCDSSSSTAASVLCIKAGGVSFVGCAW